MLKVDNLTVEKGRRKIFSNLDLHVKQGDHILINGPSGAGKSTLLKSLLMFEPIAGGDILLRGEKVTESNVDTYRHDIVYIGQKAPHYDGLVEEFLNLPFTFKANAKMTRPSNDFIEKLCTLFSFETPPLKRNYNSLSGGEQQRISIIQALLVDKPIYLLDEITTGLDPRNTVKVAKHLCAMKEKTLLIVSHDVEWKESVTRVVTIENGTLREEK